MRSNWILPAALLAALASAAPAWADRVEDDARAIEALLVAPCCWSQQVSVHQSEAAAEIKRDVRLALKAGRTRDEIVDAYVQKYGTRILIEPPAKGFATWLYVLPVAALVFSAGGLAWLLKRFAARGARATPPDADVPPGGELAGRLDEELRELD